MKVTINRAELLSAAKRAASIAPTAPPLEILKGVLLETDAAEGQLSLTATNMEVALTQTIPCKPDDSDAVVVNARLLEQMLTLLGGDNVELTREPGKPALTVTSGSARYDVPIWERKGFPRTEIPFPEDTVKVKGIPSMAKRTVFAVGENSAQPLLKCVDLMFTEDGLKAVGSDGTCMVSAKGDHSSTGDTELLIPAKSLEKLARICTNADEFRVGTTEKSVVFMKDGLLYSARTMEGKYVNADGLMNAVIHQFTVLTDVSELRNALYSALSVEAEGKVSMVFQGSKLTFRCDGAYGSASTELEVIPMTGTPQGEYSFLSRQLAACLHALHGTVTLGIAQRGMLTIATEDAFYMQPGTRLVKKAETPPKKKAA